MPERLKCSLCKKDKDISEFHNDKHHRSGKQSRCIVCNKKTRKSKYAQTANFRRYGKNTEELFYSLVEKQNNVCALCKRKETTPTKSRLSIDHDHKTNKIRGLLCSRCNGYLGWYENNAEKIHTYLKGTEMAFIDVTQTFKTLSGQVMKDFDENKEAIDATLRLAIVNALLAPTQKQESGVEKVKKYELAKKVYQNDKVELSAEDIILIKSRVGEVFPSLIVGQCFDMLEGK